MLHEYLFLERIINNESTSKPLLRIHASIEMKNLLGSPISNPKKLEERIKSFEELLEANEIPKEKIESLLREFNACIFTPHFDSKEATDHIKRYLEMKLEISKLFAKIKEIKLSEKELFLEKTEIFLKLLEKENKKRKEILDSPTNGNGSTMTNLQNTVHYVKKEIQEKYLLRLLTILKFPENKEELEKAINSVIRFYELEILDPIQIIAENNTQIIAEKWNFAIAAIPKDFGIKPAIINRFLDTILEHKEEGLSTEVVIKDRKNKAVTAELKSQKIVERSFDPITKEQAIKSIKVFLDFLKKNSAIFKSIKKNPNFSNSLNIDAISSSFVVSWKTINESINKLFCIYFGFKTEDEVHVETFPPILKDHGFIKNAETWGFFRLMRNRLVHDNSKQLKYDNKSTKEKISILLNNRSIPFSSIISELKFLLSKLEEKPLEQIEREFPFTGHL